MDMQRLFEKIADQHTGQVVAEEVGPSWVRLAVEVEGVTPCGQRTVRTVRFEVHDATIAMGGVGQLHAPLVRVESPDVQTVPILVSPVPSAILAVALR